MSQIVGDRTIEAVNECLDLLRKKGFPKLPIDYEPPIGDFALICFPAAKEMRKKPEDIAKELAIEIENLETVESVSVEKGYCNVSLKWIIFADDFLSETMHEEYSRGKGRKGTILIEHTSANATGPFHMGRARNPIIGDSIARLFTHHGHKVKTEYYVNDTGRQAATLAYGLENFRPKIEGKKDHALVSCYRQASDKLKDELEVRDSIYKRMELIEKGDKKTLEIVRKAAEEMMEGMKLSLKRLKAEADTYFHESDLIESGVVNDVIKKLKKGNLCGEENGAYYLNLESEDVAGRNQKFFFTRENGLSLYTTRDIAYHLDKFERCDGALNILGEDHKLQGKLLGIALRELGAKQPKNLFYSFVNLPGGKMSTRAGRVVYLDDIMEKIVDLAKEKLKETEIGDELKDQLAEEIGIGALRYNVLKVQCEKGFTFNFDEALNLQGDSAPFAMYSYARACSIIRKYGADIPNSKLDGEIENSELKLMRTLAKWPKIVEKAAINYSIHYIPNYVHTLSSDFNQFYRDCPVIGNKNENYRINLVCCTKKTLEEGLSIIGIKAPERM